MKTKSIVIFINLIIFSTICFSVANAGNINLAVINFYSSDSSSSKNWVGSGFTETLTQRLVKLQNLNVMDRESQRPVMEEMGIKINQAFDPTMGQSLGKNLGVDYLVTGNLKENNNQVNVSYQLFDVNTGCVVAEETLTGSLDKIFDLQAELAMKVAKFFNTPVTEELQQAVYFIPTQSQASFQKFSQGFQYYEENRINDAYNFFLNSIKEDMNFLDAHRYFQYTARQLGKLDDFIKNYEAMLARDPENPILMNYLGNAYLDKGNLNKSESLYKKSIQLSPSFGNPHNNLAAIYMLTKRYDQAVMEFEKSIKYSDKKAPVYYNMGLCYITTGDKEKATECFTTALEMDSKNPDFIVARQYLYGVKVIVKYREKKVPGDVFGEILINSEALFDIQDTAGGFSPLKRAKIISGRLQFMLNDKLEPYQIELGRMNKQIVIQTAEGKLIMTITKSLADREGTTPEELAQKKIEQLKEILNSATAVSYTTGGYVLQGPDKKEKIKDMEGVSKASTYLHKGDAYYSIGEIDKALGQYKKALESNSSFAPAHLCMGIILFNKKDYKNAISYFNNAVKYNPQYVTAYVWLGKSYLASGKKTDAKNAFSKVLSIEPDNADAKTYMKNL